jgi:homoserine dehydrogenase
MSLFGEGLAIDCLGQGSVCTRLLNILHERTDYVRRTISYESNVTHSWLDNRYRYRYLHYSVLALALAQVKE